VASAAAAVGGWSPARVFEPHIDAGEAAERLARWQRAVEAVVALA